MPVSTPAAEDVDEPAVGEGAVTATDAAGASVGDTVTDGMPATDGGVAATVDLNKTGNADKFKNLLDQYEEQYAI